MSSRIEKLNAAQLTAKDSESWHNDYKDSAYIYIGGLAYNLTEGDVVCIFSQYGEPLDVNLIRDKQTGKSKGFAFLRYADQRSTVLAVDNLTGSIVLGRALRVDHCNQYKQPKGTAGNAEVAWDQDPRAAMNVAPPTIAQKTEVVQKQGEDYAKGIDPEDPMYAYLVQQRKEEVEARNASSSSKKQRRQRSHHRSSDRSHRRHRRRSHSRSPSRSRSPKPRCCDSMTV